MDLLGSILGTMQKPPTMSDAERKKVKAQKDMVEKQQEKDKNKLQQFREQMQKKIADFIKDGTQQKMKFEPQEKTLRAIVHEVADIASLTSFSFGLEEQDRYVMLWKKEFAPSDEEILAYRKDEVWDPEQAKVDAQIKAQERLEADSRLIVKKAEPNTNYKDKYRHLIGDIAAKDAAQSTKTNRSYGFVSSENKRDQRTIEQVMADNKAKRQKTDNQSTSVDNCDKTETQSDSQTIVSSANS